MLFYCTSFYIQLFDFSSICFCKELSKLYKRYVIYKKDVHFATVITFYTLLCFAECCGYKLFLSHFHLLYIVMMGNVSVFSNLSNDIYLYIPHYLLSKD